MRFAAVILAAGEASRMGVAKQVLPYGSSTLIGTVVETARRSIVDDVVVVTGFHSDEVTAEVGDVARIVHNPDAATGNMSSLVSGIDAVPDAAGVVVLLSDMPQIASATIDALLNGVIETGSVAGWVSYSDGKAHPLVLRASTFDTVRTLEGPKAVWQYLDSLDSDSLFALSVEQSRPIDINAEDDYRSAIQDLQGGAKPPS